MLSIFPKSLAPYFYYFILRLAVQLKIVNPRGGVKSITKTAN